jgi:hypothetical protein
MLDFHGDGLTGGENDVLGYVIDMDSHRDALRQAHPGEDRVDGREASRAGFRVGTLMPRAMLSTWPRTTSLVAHQLELGRIALADGAQRGLGEVGIDPEGIGIDQRQLVLPDIGVVAELREAGWSPSR